VNIFLLGVLLRGVDHFERMGGDREFNQGITTFP